MLEAIKQFKENRQNYPEELCLRIHRVLSWLNQAEQSDDLDTNFIFLWIAFNAIYAKDLSLTLRGGADKSLFTEFLYRIC